MRLVETGGTRGLPAPFSLKTYAHTPQDLCQNQFLIIQIQRYVQNLVKHLRWSSYKDIFCETPRIRCLTAF